jgi:hypothetical protein
VQEYPNVEAPSPLGSCKGSMSDDPSCPNLEGESYYPCPAQGCFLYVVKLNGGDPGYQPGASTCAPYAGDKFTQPHPTPRFKLAYKLDASSPLVVTTEDPGIGGHSNYKPTQAPWSQGICPSE